MSGAGAACLILRSRQPASGSLADANAAWYGEEGEDAAGHDLDMDGDGYADLVVGAFYSDLSATDAGTARLGAGSGLGL